VSIALFNYDDFTSRASASSSESCLLLRAIVAPLEFIGCLLA
jgi:hypothetical protein